MLPAHGPELRGASWKGYDMCKLQLRGRGMSKRQLPGYGLCPLPVVHRSASCMQRDLAGTGLQSSIVSLDTLHRNIYNALGIPCIWASLMQRGNAIALAIPRATPQQCHRPTPAVQTYISGRYALGPADSDVDPERSLSGTYSATLLLWFSES